MNIRAKFEVSRVTEFGSGGKRLEIYQYVEREGGKKYEPTGVPVREITLTAIYGTDGENASFSEATPSGTITFQLNNPAVAEEFKPGQRYYVDFTPVPALLDDPALCAMKKTTSA